jgi:ribosomal protein S18 acetylase RimI-like enzyme
VPREVRIEEVSDVFDGLLPVVEGLVRQLSRSAVSPTQAELEAIVASPASRLLVARDADGAIVGTLTLVVFRIPTGVRAWIEDVVVDRAAQGRGVGQALTTAAVRLAYENGARTVDLTSRPSREAANRMYQKLGFRARETIVYRFEDPTA